MKKALILVLAGGLVFASGCQKSSHFGSTPTPVLAPSAPNSVTAKAGDGTVVLQWNGVSGAFGYNVYYSTQSGVTKAGTKLSAGALTSCTVSGLTDGTAYYFVVTATNSTGESALSTEISATPLLPAPAAPTGLSATGGPAQVALTWTAVSNATSYNLYYSTTTGVTTANGTKVTGISSAAYTVTGLTSGTPYYFIVTAVNAGGESLASAQATATPTGGAGVSLTPGTSASTTVAFSSANSLTFQFPANAVSSPADVDILPVDQSALPVPLSRFNRAHAAAMPQVQANDTFILAFQLSIDPTSITAFNVPVGVSGTVDPTVSSTGVTLNLAILSGQQWVDVATFVVGAKGTLTENLVSTSLQGLLAPGTYIVYQPAKGTSTSVSNLGVALIADDGPGMADGSNGLQIVHFYDKNGVLLATPVISYLDYSGQGDLDGQAMTPDGSQGIMVDGSNLLSFFSAVQTGVPIASTATLDITNYGGDGDSVGILPNGDEAVVSGDDPSVLLIVSGIVSGTPVAAETISVPDYRDGVTVSNDGNVLLARGPTGLTVFSIADITPVAGSLGGMVSHSYTQVTDMTTMGTDGDIEDGRDGMAVSPTDSSRAIVVFPSTGTVQLITGLPAKPVAGASVTLPTGAFPLSVSISPDGKLAVVGTLSQGLFLISGVDTATLTQVGTAYAPTYTLAGQSVTLGSIPTLGITLDGKYVIAADAGDLVNYSVFHNAVVVIPFTASGFATAPAAVLDKVAIPSNDQLLIH